MGSCHRTRSVVTHAKYLVVERNEGRHWVRPPADGTTCTRVGGTERPQGLELRRTCSDRVYSGGTETGLNCSRIILHWTFCLCPVVACNGGGGSSGNYLEVDAGGPDRRAGGRWGSRVERGVS